MISSPTPTLTHPLQTAVSFAGPAGQLLRIRQQLNFKAHHQASAVAAAALTAVFQKAPTLVTKAAAAATVAVAAVAAAVAVAVELT